MNRTLYTVSAVPGTVYYTNLPSDSRMSALPWGRPKLKRYIDLAIRSFWPPTDIVRIDVDRSDYETKLTPEMRRAVDHILTFFMIGDKIVNVNIGERFKQEMPIPEIEYFYNAQMAIEDVHAIVYSELTHGIVDHDRVASLTESLTTNASIAAMTRWAKMCIDSDEPLPVRVFRMACFEGVFFQSCFVVIYWLKSKGLMPALGQSNGLIARDEALHTEFGIELLNSFFDTEHRPSLEAVHAIAKDAIAIASDFVTDMVPIDTPGMNSRLLIEYCMCECNNLLVNAGYTPYNNVTTHNFPFMDQKNMRTHVNFFERKPHEYSQQSVTEPDDDLTDY